MGNTYPENTVSGEALIDEIFNSQNEEKLQSQR